MTNQEKIELLDSLHKLYKERDLEGIHNNLFEKLDLLGYLHEQLGEKKVKLKDNEILLESLIIKFYFHGLSICQLSKGFKIKSNFFETESFIKHDFIDISSILTIGRAQMESFLMYQHLYINDSNEDEQKLRYYTWLYTALLQRINLPKGKNFDNAQLDPSIKELEEFKSKIEKNSAFLKLSEKQQKGLIEKGTSKCFKTWDAIFEEANLSKNGMFNRYYYIISTHAHSEGLSAMQLKSNKYFLNGQNNQGAIFLQLMSSWFMTAIMITNLVERFEVIKEKYESIEERIKFEIDFLKQIPVPRKPTA